MTGAPPRPRLTPDDYRRFVPTWQSAESVGGAAAVLNLTKIQATRIATRLRRRGIGLKRLRAKGRGVLSDEFGEELKRLAREAIP